MVKKKYRAKGLGPQDARKGIIFQSFPPVLCLQLKRYGYDMLLDNHGQEYLHLRWIVGMILTLP